MSGKMFVFDEAMREQIGEKLRDLAHRVYLRRVGRGDEAVPPQEQTVPDPDEGDAAMGKAWLEDLGVQVLAPGVPMYFQTLQSLCIVLPPFELVDDPVPPPDYGFPEFYCEQCAKPDGSAGPVDRPFYMKRLADYTLSHCGD